MCNGRLQASRVFLPLIMGHHSCSEEGGRGWGAPASARGSPRRREPRPPWAVPSHRGREVLADGGLRSPQSSTQPCTAGQPSIGTAPPGNTQSPAGQCQEQTVLLTLGPALLLLHPAVLTGSVPFKEFPCTGLGWETQNLLELWVLSLRDCPQSCRTRGPAPHARCRPVERLASCAPLTARYPLLESQHPGFASQTAPVPSTPDGDLKSATGSPLAHVLLP